MRCERVNRYVNGLMESERNVFRKMFSIPEFGSDEDVLSP
jgi:hypothetical protein